MTRTTWAIAAAGGAWLAWLLAGPAGSGVARAVWEAGDVSSTAPGSQPAESRPARTGHWQIDAALDRIVLSAEQVERLNPILEDFCRRLQEARTGQQEQTEQIKRKLALTAEPQQAQALWQQARELYAAHAQAAEQLARQLQEAIIKALPAAEGRRFGEILEELSDTPAGRLRRYVRDMMLPYAELGLSQSQRQRMVEILTARREEFLKNARVRELWEDIARAKKEGDAAAEDAARDKLNRIQEQLALEDKAAREQVERELTAEQKHKLKQAVLESVRQWRESAIRWITRPLADLKLTAEQKERIEAIVAAARKATDEQPPETYQARAAVAQKLLQDVRDVLTEAQKEEFDRKTSAIGQTGSAGRPEAEGTKE